MTRGLRGFLFQICGHCGDKGQCWRLWLQPFITLIRERAQLPLPMAARVPKRIPNADSFVGIPFMRPTLRMHWPSRLQRHTNTGVGNEDESVREASQLLGTSCLENCPRDVFVCTPLQVCASEGAYSSVYVAGYMQIYPPSYRYASVWACAVSVSMCDCMMYPGSFPLYPDGSLRN